MAVRLENPQKAEKLFGAWPEVILWSCLQNVMGAVYVDDSENPRSAMAILGDFSFFAGQPDAELILYRPDGNKFMIMVPQNDAWSDLIRQYYGDRAKAITRYAIKKKAIYLTGINYRRQSTLWSRNMK